MKTSITIATALLVAAGATGIAAVLPVPYQGSDTLYTVTKDAITAVGTIGPASSYVGGGSGNAQSSMANSGGGSTNPSAKQQTGPMSRMINNGNSVCLFGLSAPGTAGSGDTAASGIVIGLDAVDVLSSNHAGTNPSAAATTCAGSGNGTLVASGSPATVFGGTATPQNWKWALALVYGGLDLSQSPAVAADCNSAARKNLVANWSQLFQAGCTFDSTASTSGESANALCAAAAHTGIKANTSIGATGAPLWHAFRRDEASGTSDVFSSILGISPSTSNSALHGFGTSPYCNALNWDSAAGNSICQIAGSAAASAHDQFTGPGGVVDPMSACVIGGACGAAGTGNHRMPPQSCIGGTGCAALSGTACRTTAGCSLVDVYGDTGSGAAWGSDPATSQTPVASDVLPTQMQDNDPIRRPCIGGAVSNHLKAGEEVCNLDGNLGLVVPMVDTDWMLTVTSKGTGGGTLSQFPTSLCNAFAQTGIGIKVITCANKSAVAHQAECPNGDDLSLGFCDVPINATSGSSQCANSSGVTDPAPTGLRPFPLAYGRVYNSQMRDGSIGTAGATIFNAQYPIPALGTTVDMGGAYNRIHEAESAAGVGITACQMQDMTDQIGCLTAADPCSIGYAGDASKTWTTRTNGAVAAGFVGTDAAGFWSTDAMQVASIYPSTTSVQLLGKVGEYQLSRKLYFASLVGFGNVTATAGDPGGPDEITLAQFESVSTNIKPILTNDGFFGLGPLSPAGADTPFCEDFNEQTVCGASANVNGCTGNPSGIPTVNTVCGDGVVGAFEECDGTVNAGAGGCSATCRCKHDFNETTGVCN